MILVVFSPCLNNRQLYQSKNISGWLVSRYMESKLKICGIFGGRNFAVFSGGPWVTWAQLLWIPGQPVSPCIHIWWQWGWGILFGGCLQEKWYFGKENDFSFLLCSLNLTKACSFCSLSLVKV